MIEEVDTASSRDGKLEGTGRPLLPFQKRCRFACTARYRMDILVTKITDKQPPSAVPCYIAEIAHVDVELDLFEGYLRWGLLERGTTLPRTERCVRFHSV